MDESKLSEGELIEAAQSDRRAFGVLYDRYFDRIYQYVARRVGDEATAEDIAGEVWERALVAIERFEMRGVPFIAWLYRIAGNQIANHHRRRNLLTFVTIEPRHGKRGNPADRLDEQEVVRNALLKLSDADQEVLGLAYFADMTPPEMADVLGCNVAAVHKRMHRARNRLRERVEGDSRVSFPLL